MYNFFEAPQPKANELIPTGTPLFVEMTFTPGGHGEDGCLTKSKPSAENPNPDTAYLKCEFTVLRGPYKSRKFWSNFTLEGGERDENGHSKAGVISAQTLRKIIYSAHGLRSDDMTPNAKAICEKYGKLQALNGIRFVCRAAVGKERAGYQQKNELGGHWNIMTVDSKRWPTEHELDNPATAKPAAPAPAAPVWNNGGASVGISQPNTGAIAAPATAASPFNTPAAAPVDVPAAAIAAAKASDVPNWMLSTK